MLALQLVLEDCLENWNVQVVNLQRNAHQLLLERDAGVACRTAEYNLVTKQVCPAFPESREDRRGCEPVQCSLYHRCEGGRLYTR